MSEVERSEAVTAAEAGAQAWRRVVHAQQTAAADHGDFYALAAELVETLRSLEALARLSGGQVAGYGQGRAVYDDAGGDPAVRLLAAAGELDSVRMLVAGAEASANRFFSAIGHIGVQLTGEEC